jgi:hypothetical protein
MDVCSGSGADQDLFASLEGLVNHSQPQIACVGKRAPDQAEDN